MMLFWLEQATKSICISNLKTYKFGWLKENESCEKRSPVSWKLTQPQSRINRFHHSPWTILNRTRCRATSFQGNQSILLLIIKNKGAIKPTPWFSFTTSRFQVQMMVRILRSHFVDACKCLCFSKVEMKRKWNDESIYILSSFRNTCNIPTTARSSWNRRRRWNRQRSLESPPKMVSM